MPHSRCSGNDLWGRCSFCADFADGISEVRVTSQQHTDSTCQSWGGNPGARLPCRQSWEERLALGSWKVSLFSWTTSCTVSKQQSSQLCCSPWGDLASEGLRLLPHKGGPSWGGPADVPPAQSPHPPQAGAPGHFPPPSLLPLGW